MPPDDVASVIVTGAFVAGNAALASAVWVSGAGAGGSLMPGLTPPSCPTVGLSSRLAAEIAGLTAPFASDALSVFAAEGASEVGSLAAAGCGTTFCAISRGCEKSAGVISPGVTTTRAPILVQPHIFTAKAIGMRMQPCDAG